MNKLNKNELYVELPEGKLHVYVTEMTPNTKDGLIHLDDDYMKSIHVDLIDKDEKKYKLSKTEYQFTRTDDLDEDGNKIWMERFWVTGKDIEPPIDISDLKKLSPEEEVIESKRVSSNEYIEKVKEYFGIAENKSERNVQNFSKVAIQKYDQMIEHYEMVLKDLSGEIYDLEMESSKEPVVLFLKQMQERWKACKDAFTRQF